MKLLAFIESNKTGSGEDIIRKAIDRGMHVLLMSADPNAYSFIGILPINVVVIDTANTSAMLEYLKNIEGLKGILSTSEYFLEQAALLSKKIGFVGNDPMSIRLCMDKARFSELAQKKALPVPSFFKANNIHQVKKLASELSYPVVVKPAEGTGSVNVLKCETFDEVLTHCQKILSYCVNERGEPVTPQIVIQHFIPGKEYSIEAFGCGNSTKIIGITEKHLGNPPNFAEIGHDFPSELIEEEKKAIEELVQRTLQIVGLKYGPSHTEVRVNDGKVTLIELNPRLAGGMLRKVIEYVHQVDLLNRILDVTLNPEESHLIEWPHTLNSPESFASVRYIMANKKGVIENIDLGFNSKSGVLDFGWFKKPGDFLDLHGDYRDRLGFVVTSANTVHESRQKCCEIIENIEIEINPEHVSETTFNPPPENYLGGYRE